MQSWKSFALRLSFNDAQLPRSPPRPLSLATALSILMPVKSKINQLRKKPSAILKRPVASQSGNPGDAAGWEDFKIVPFSNGSDAGKDGKTFTHLSLDGELKRAPAVVKHIQGGTLHTSTGCQSVKDFLKSLERKGDDSWLKEWDAAGHADKRAIMERLKLQLDEKSVLTVRQSTSAGSRTEHKQVRGWMSLWEVADVEKIPFDPKYSSLLMDCVADDESKAHSNPTLAKKGWREYYHVKKKATVETMYHDDQHSANANVTPENEEDFEASRLAITQASLGRSSTNRTSSMGNRGILVHRGGGNTKAGQWKAKADEMIRLLSDAENRAASLQADITTAIDNESNPALQRKHASLAAGWAKKLALKKALVMKQKTIASTAREDIFDKDGNKFEDCLKGANSLKEEWEGENNLTLLEKLMDF